MGEMKMKLISWNVNGLRAILGKDFKEQFEKFDADIVGIQEIKLQEGQHDFEPEGYHAYYNYAIKKGYSGTAVYTKMAPLSVQYGMGEAEHDNEGRMITLEFEDFYYITVYTPNSQRELKRLDYRMKWEESFREYVMALDAKKPVIICGDLNVAHKEIDLKNPKGNRRNPGFSDEEREKMTELLSSGFIDTFRHIHGDVEERYSWWSYRFNSRAKNTGWRIDYFLVSKRLEDRIEDADILDQEYGSDHAPVLLVLK